MRLLTIAFVALTLTFSGCGSKSSSDKKVWCVAPGEKVTAKFKKEYPELYMSKSACDAVNK